jgi:quinoprotein glucose dehydrogenase
MRIGLVLVAAGIAIAQQYSTWRDYAGGADGAQYSSLTQIDRGNIGRLELAWFSPAPGGGAFNPIVIDGVLYALGAERSIVALDAATGKPIWSHPVEGSPAERGINYWENADRSDRRLIFTANSYLQEIHAKTGVSINTFGKDGRVNLREGLDRDPKSIRNIQSKNPGRVFENLIILGSVTGEQFGSPPGDIRAYDVKTGRMAWTFHTIPRPGEFGYETWPKDAYRYAGGANVWGEMALDEKRGILYAPTGSPTFDLYGADRKGANLFGNCLIALDARTGKRLWHFQAVHHDLWDYDLTTAPKLLTVTHDGKRVDVVAQAGKSGFLYVFDRVTGAPLWPIEERPVPKSEVPGEESWPTQPFPTAPPPFARQKFGVDEINPYLAADERERLKQTLLKAANQGVYTPASHLRNHIAIPGAFGGANWGAIAVDPAKGWIYVRSYDAPSIRTLTERPGSVRLPANATTEQRGYAAYLQNCSSCHGPERDGIPRGAELTEARLFTTVRNGRGEMPSFEPEAVSDANLRLIAAYLRRPDAGGISEAAASEGPRSRGSVERPAGLRNFSGPFGAQWLSKDGLPAIAPPWSELVAYDLNAGAIRWRVPAGEIPSLVARGIRDTGSYRPRGAPVVTAGGLIFLGTGSDHTFRAYDQETGKTLWQKAIDGNPDGIPAVYEVGGREFVVWYAAGDPGGGSRTPANFLPGKPEAAGYYAFALPGRK